MSRWVRALAGLALCCLVVASGAEASERQRILASQALTTAGGPVSVTVATKGPGPIYLVINTSSEVATASLEVTADLAHQFSDTNTLCTSSAITTETTTVVLIGSDATAGSGVATVCPFPLAEATTFTFTVTGASAGFTVAADLISLP